MEDLATIPIPKIDQQQKDLLECPVTDYEIEKAIHQLSPHKAPGPDGIPTLFYREFWSIAKQDILNSTHAFFHSGIRKPSRIFNTKVTNQINNFSGPQIVIGSSLSRLQLTEIGEQGGVGMRMKLGTWRAESSSQVVPAKEDRSLI